MQLLDWLVLAGYALLVIGLGILAERRSRSASGWFLGDRSLPWPLVGISILATAFSATSLLGGPGEGYRFGMLWMQLQLGDLLAILIVAWLFIPALRGQDAVTAYEFLERRFDLRVRGLASLLFHLQLILRTGILVYGPALALSTITGMGLTETILLIGVLATLYTVLGGITAVVWTDTLQLAVVLIGLFLTIAVIGARLDGGLAAAISVASAEGRLAWVDLSQSPHSVRSLAGAVIGYGVLSLAVAGTNQQPVQRYLACRDVAAARRAALLGWAIGAGVTLLTLFVGALLFAFYRQHALPEELATDAIFPHFIAQSLPAGLRGLLVAGILAAAMSSLDSALNSLATASVHDFQLRIFRPQADPSRQLRWARAWTVIWGIVGTAAALWVAGRGSLLSMAVRYVGYFAGPMLGLFLLALRTRRVTASAALAGLLFSFAGVLCLVNAPSWFGWNPPVRGIWIASAGTLLCLFAAFAFQLPTRRPRR